jgi:acyl carrier protein
MKNGIKEVMAKIFKVELSTLPDDLSPETVKEWTSLKHMELVLSLEKKFDVRFADDQIAELLSLSLVEEAIVKLQSA